MNWRGLLGITVALAVAAVAGVIVIRRPDIAIRSATGAAADALCAKPFVSGLDPQASFAEIMDRPGIRRLRFGMRYQLDRAARKLDVSVAGLFATHTIFREGFGCVRVLGGKEPYLLKADIVALKTPKAPPLLPEIAGPDNGRAVRSGAEGPRSITPSRNRPRRRCAEPRPWSWCATAASSPSVMPPGIGIDTPLLELLHDQVADQRAARRHDAAGLDLAVLDCADSEIVG